MHKNMDLAYELNRPSWGITILGKGWF
ncbi:hypothetical protein Q604_UNBC02036G0002, partial [human gut metagenome]